MMWLLLSIASANCPVVLETRQAYTPMGGELTAAGDPGQWDKSMLSRLSSSKRALVTLYKKEFRSYPTDVQNEVLAGVARKGLDEVAHSLAWGEPEFFWEAGRCRGSLWGIDDDRRVAIQACEGAVTEQVELIRSLPCVRAQTIGPRLARNRKDLGAYSFAQQLDIVAGHRAAWMTGDAMALTFGENSESGIDEGPIHDQPIEIQRSAEAVAAKGSEAGEPPAESLPDIVQTADVLGAEVAAPDSIPMSTYRFDVDCGSTRWRMELELAAEFGIRATHRSNGSVSRRASGGTASRVGDHFELYGLGTLSAEEPPVLSLGPWPEAACSGVSTTALP